MKVHIITRLCWQFLFTSHTIIYLCLYYSTGIVARHCKVQVCGNIYYIFIYKLKVYFCTFILLNHQYITSNFCYVPFTMYYDTWIADLSSLSLIDIFLKQIDHNDKPLAKISLANNNFRKVKFKLNIESIISTWFKHKLL